jgi:hypothetical protein
MDFQLKIEVLLRHIRPPLFDVGDTLVLYTLLAPVCDATDLTNTIQWLRVLRSLLLTYLSLRLVLCCITVPTHSRFNAAIADGIRRWFLTRRPLCVADREESMNALMMCMAEELRRRSDGSRWMRTAIEVLGSRIEWNEFIVDDEWRADAVWRADA